MSGTWSTIHATISWSYRITRQRQRVPVGGGLGGLWSGKAQHPSSVQPDPERLQSAEPEVTVNVRAGTVSGAVLATAATIHLHLDRHWSGRLQLDIHGLFVVAAHPESRFLVVVMGHVASLCSRGGKVVRPGGTGRKPRATGAGCYRRWAAIGCLVPPAVSRRSGCSLWEYRPRSPSRNTFRRIRAWLPSRTERCRVVPRRSGSHVPSR